MYEWFINCFSSAISRYIGSGVVGYFLAVIFFNRRISSFEKELTSFAQTLKDFKKYGNNIPPTYCQYCNSNVQFSLSYQKIVAGKSFNAYKCPKCGEITYHQTSPY